MITLPSLVGWSSRKSMAVYAIIVAVGGMFAYLLVTDYTHISRTVYGQLFDNIFNSEKYQSSLESRLPAIQTGPTSRSEVALAQDVGIVALLGLVAFGFYSTVFLRLFHSTVERVAASVFSTLALVGFYALALSMQGLLFHDIFVVAVVLTAVILNIITIKSRGRVIITLLSSIASKRAWRRQRLTCSPSLAAFVIGPLVATFSLSFFYAAALPVTDFDALIYHAEVAKIIYEQHYFPLFQGPSIGIEISGNYPPLFSGIAAGLYTLFGRFDDVMLRVLPPVFGLVMALGAYRIGEIVSKGSGKYVLLVLLATPLFVHNLLISSTTTLFSAGVVLSVLSVLSLGRTDKKSDAEVSYSGAPQRRFFSKNQLAYVFLAGIFMGLSLLASYQALFYLVVPACTLAVLAYRRKMAGGNFRMVIILGILFGVALATASLWYGRTAALHGNPFYPWVLDNQTEDQRAELFGITKRDIQAVGSSVTFGKSDFDFLDSRALFRNHPLLFPSFSVIAIIGAVYSVHRSARNVWLVLWAGLPILLILSFGTVFPRYLLPLVPAFAICFGLLVNEVLRRATLHRTAYLLVPALVLSLYLTVGLPVAMVNPAVNMGDYDDKFYFLRNAEKPEMLLGAFYQSDVSAWRWISENAGPERKIMTFDPRLYYMGDYRNVLALDGLQSLPLYSMENVDDIKAYLRDRDAQYIFDAATAKSSLWGKLPLTRYLGSEDFPEAVSFGASKIYRVN